MFRLPDEEVPRCGGRSRARDQAHAQDDGQGKSRHGPRLDDGGGIGQHPVDSDGVRDVLDLAVAERLIAANQFMLDLFVDASGDKEVSRIGNSLKPRCNVDAITIDVVRLDNDVPEIDANSILDPLLTGERRVAPDHALLDDDGAADGFDRAVEHGEKAVTRTFNKSSVMLDDGGVNELAPMSLHPRVRSLLIHCHEPAIAGDVSGHDSCETPWRPIGWIGSISPRSDVMDLTWHSARFLSPTELFQAPRARWLRLSGSRHNLNCT